jgi:hypothetical protein
MTATVLAKSYVRSDRQIDQVFGIGEIGSRDHYSELMGLVDSGKKNIRRSADVISLPNSLWNRSTIS